MLQSGGRLGPFSPLCQSFAHISAQRLTGGRRQPPTSPSRRSGAYWGWLSPPWPLQLQREQPCGLAQQNRGRRSGTLNTGTPVGECIPGTVWQSPLLSKHRGCSGHTPTQGCAWGPWGGQSPCSHAVSLPTFLHPGSREEHPPQSLWGRRSCRWGVGPADLTSAETSLGSRRCQKRHFRGCAKTRDSDPTGGL